jgi:hypothetical protein
VKNSLLSSEVIVGQKMRTVSEFDKNLKISIITASIPQPYYTINLCKIRQSSFVPSARNQL